MGRDYRRLTEWEKKAIKFRFYLYSPRENLEVGVIKEVPNRYDAELGDVAVLRDYSLEKPTCKAQFLDFGTRCWQLDCPSDLFRILRNKTIRKLKRESLETRLRVIVRHEYDGHKCTSCGYRKRLKSTDDFAELIFLQYQLVLKNYPNREKNGERVAKFKLARFDCPECGEKETFYSSSLENELSELDKQHYWK